MAKDFFAASNSKEPVADVHAIITEHPRMIALGLGVFTTGDLNAWLQTLEGITPLDPTPPPQEFYKNWRAVNYASIDDILGHGSKDEDDWGVFHAWRRSEATGKYAQKSISAWDYSYMGLDGAFTQDDLLLGSYWNLSDPDGVVFTHISPDGEDIADGWTSRGQTPSRFGRNFFSGSQSSILQIIEMNRFVNQFRRFYPRGEWLDSAHADLQSANLFAMDSFLTDIKASKYGFLEFYADIPFNINQAGGGIQCVKVDRVKFKLYLYDDSKVRNSNKLVVLKDPKFSGYKRDTLGRVYRSSNDGEMVEANTSNAGERSVGELERRWNTYTQKWESGSANIFAKTVTNIRQAVNNPSVESLVDSDIKQDLDGDPDRHFAPSSGLCMPIEMQNGNPMQWQPNYARASGCREESREKATVVGYNHNPLKSYPKDTLVMLTQMGGIWHITDMGSGIIDDEISQVDATIEGKWEFQYMGTNSNNYFVALDWDGNTANIPAKKTKVDPEAIERAVHRNYYYDDPFNGGDGVTLFGGLLGVYDDYYDGEEIRWSKRGQNPLVSMNGYWQFTSFDFMDAILGGTHSHNFLASTNALQNSAGVQTGSDEEALGQSAHTGGFFGCCFPDGYTLETTNAYFNAPGTERDFVIFPASNGVSAFSAAGSNFNSKLFNTNILNNSPAVEPFIDPAPGFQRKDQLPTINDFDNQGHPIVLEFPYGGNPPEALSPLLGAYVPERSKLRSVLPGADPEAPNPSYDTQYDREGESRRAPTRPSNPYYSPSMFYQETHYNARDLRHLPADIGTLSAPGTENGCPIQNIHAYAALMSSTKGPIMREAVKDIFRERHWLFKSTPLPTTEQQYSSSDSAYGFKPKRVNKIQFSPLKYGTWTQFIGGWGKIADYVYGADGTKRFDELDRRDKAAEAVRFYHASDGNSIMPICSEDSYLRNLTWLGYENSVGTRPIATAPGANKYIALHSLWDVNKGLKLRGDLKQDGMSLNVMGYGGRAHSREWWKGALYNGDTYQHKYTSPSHFPNNLKDGQTGDNIGANVFGVIGATATAAANQQITFNTRNTLGMMCESKRGITSAYLKPSWGGSDVNTLYSNRTTALFATVYHAHAREDTIYDPRYFAVHHFNSDGLNLLNPAVPGYFNNDPILYIPTPFQKRVGRDIVTITQNIMTRDVVLDANGVPYQDKDNFYKIGENRMFFKEVAQPTRYGPDGDAPVTCQDGDQVFKDVVLGQTAILPEQFWNFTSDRVGKLLPYRYFKRQIGVPFTSGVVIDLDSAFTSHTSDVDDREASTHVDELIIKSSGENYKKGDILGNIGTKINISVEEVMTVNKPNKPGEQIRGVVSKIKVYNPGVISPNLLPNSDAKLKDGVTDGVAIRNIAAAGTGFDAFFVNGKVYTNVPIDHKPRYLSSAGRYVQLSADADLGRSDSVTNTRDDPQIILGGWGNLFGFGGGGGVTTNKVGKEFGVVYTGRDVSVQIKSDERSPNSKYDIFFHMHNDITFTLTDPDRYADTQNPYEVIQNWIETTINAI